MPSNTFYLNIQDSKLEKKRGESDRISQDCIFIFQGSAAQDNRKFKQYILLLVFDFFQEQKRLLQIEKVARF